VTAFAWKRWKRADVQQICIAKAFGFDGFKLEAELLKPAEPPTKKKANAQLHQVRKAQR
jgi:hypothetical protein